MKCTSQMLYFCKRNLIARSLSIFFSRERLLFVRFRFVCITLLLFCFLFSILLLLLLFFLLLSKTIVIVTFFSTTHFSYSQILCTEFITICPHTISSFLIVYFCLQLFIYCIHSKSKSCTEFFPEPF